MQPINESILLAAIQQCLATADHYIRQGNRRDAGFYLDTADAYATRLTFCRQIDGICRAIWPIVKPTDRNDIAGNG